MYRLLSTPDIPLHKCAPVKIRSPTFQVRHLLVTSWAAVTRSQQLYYLAYSNIPHQFWEIDPNTIFFNFQIATAGKENRLQLWDLSRPDVVPVFSAKNVKHDKLELRVPVWVTDICFPDALSPSSVATVSRYGHIRWVQFSYLHSHEKSLFEET